MPRWLRVIRGMIGTGLTFAVGVGGLMTLLGLAGMIFGDLTWREMAETAGQFTFASFLVGMAFSGVLAIVARRKTFDKLSLPGVMALGAGGGLIYFGAIATNAWSVWSPRVAFINFALLTGIGAVAAAVTLLIARRARRALKSGDEMASLTEGDVELPLTQSSTKEKVNR